MSNESNADQVADSQQSPQQSDSTQNDQTTITSNATQVGEAKPLAKLTKKQNVFVRALVENPKLSATKAAKLAYNTTTDNGAAQIATENLRKPNIMAELAKYTSKAEYNLMLLADKTTEYALQGGHVGAAYASVSRQVNDSILDRQFGKATQRTEHSSTSVVLNIDLTTTV